VDNGTYNREANKEEEKKKKEKEKGVLAT